MTLTFMKLIINNFYLWIKKLLLYIYIKKIKFIYKKWNHFKKPKDIQYFLYA